MDHDTVFPEEKLHPGLAMIEVNEDFDMDEATWQNAVRLSSLICLKPARLILQTDLDGWFSIHPVDVAIASHQGSTSKLGRQNSPFSLQVVDTPDVAAAVTRDIGSHDDGEWAAIKWMEDSARRGLTVLAARVRGTLRYGAMASFSRKVEIFGDDSGGLDLYYTYHGEHLYVVPPARGRRLSSALRVSIAEVLSSDVDDLSRFLSSGKAKGFGGLKLQFQVCGEAHSTEGLRFLDDLTADLEEAVDEAFSERQLVESTVDDRVMPNYGL